MERLKRGLVLFLASIGSIRKKCLKKGERLKRGLVVFLASIGSVPKRLGGSVRLDGESECHVDATLINKKSMIINRGAFDNVELSRVTKRTYFFFVG